MPRDPGKQKRAQKQKKRRDARKKVRAERQETRRAPAGADLVASCGYDAAVAPVPRDWQMLAEQARLDAVTRYHDVALASGERPPSMARHAGMHVIVENQIADRAPEQVRHAMSRLMGEGMSRHDAIHAIGWVLAAHMRRAMAERVPVDEAKYAADVGQLTLARWLSDAGR
jgi:hypothetical protein